MTNAAFEYYSGKNDYIPAVVGHLGAVTSTELFIPNYGIEIDNGIPEHLKSGLGEKVELLYSSVAARSAVVDGHEYVFETGYLIGDDDGEMELRAATYQSSLTGNMGNGFEVARLGVYNPQRSYVYVGSLGNGLSSPLPAAERRFLRMYGSLLYKEEGVTKALPVVHALGRVLFDQGFQVTRLGSDSSGALLTVAYGAMYGDGAITAVHQNVRPNIVDKKNTLGVLPLQLGKDMLRTEQVRSVAHSKVSLDALRMTTEVASFTRDHVGDEYRSKNYKPHTSFAMKFSNAIGLGRGPKQGDPLMSDNVALLRNNQEANILFTVGSRDPLAESTDLPQRMRKIAHNLSFEGDGDMTTVIVEGSSHSLQTHYPQFLQALGRAVLG
jgi:hypothetical protein